MTLPSMLTYRFHADKQIDHVVLGKGPPGGSWHRMDPNLRTLSLSNWMSLPGYDFSTWEKTHPVAPAPHPRPSPIAEHRLPNSHDSIVHQTIDSNRSETVLISDHTTVGQQCRLCMDHDCSAKDRSSAPRSHPHRSNLHRQRTTSLSDKSESTINGLSDHNNNTNTIDSSTEGFRLPRRNLAIQRQVSKEVQTRALVSRVAEYYESYVHEMGLANHFVNDTVVTSVQPLKCDGAGRHQRVRWIVRG